MEQCELKSALCQDLFDFLKAAKSITKKGHSGETVEKNVMKKNQLTTL